MNKDKDMESPLTLTEFAPLSPEGSPPTVSSFFSKLFRFSSSSSSQVPVTTSNNDNKSIPPDSGSSTPSISKKSAESDTSSVISYSVDTCEARSLPNVLKRISNIVASKNSNLQSYKDSDLRNYWMPDSVSKQCYECSERFTTFRRRHHCRVCGQIFCSKCCCDEIPGKIMGCTGDLRVCTYCCKVVLSYLQSSDMDNDLSADLKALQEDLEEKYGDNSPPAFKKSKNVNTQKSSERKPSVGYMEEKYSSGKSRKSKMQLTSQERIFALQNSSSLRMIYEELFRSNKAILLQTHRIYLNRYHDCFSGQELVNWMIAQNKAATRIQATAIGQALFEAKFIEPVLHENEFTDNYVLYKPTKLNNLQNKEFSMEKKVSCDAQEPAWVKNIPQSESTDSENESKQPFQYGRSSSDSSNFYLDLNVEASTVTLKRPTSEDRVSTKCNDNATECTELNMKTHDLKSKNSADLLNDILQVQEIKGKNGWHSSLKNNQIESQIFNSLRKAYKRHHDSLLKQLLNKENLSENWSEVILQISNQIIEHVKPNLNHDSEDMDIRQYVQIKKSPGGTKNDCEIVSGVVCNKNVAHKNMNAMIANPKILLLRCGLTYQRVEGKLLSLEPIMLQESEYLGHAVARITALGPDIVLVHRSVSRLAQDKLRESGVTLVLNVKLSTLERLARCTNASIVDSIDAHITTRYQLGVCKKFFLRNFPCEKWGVKTLMYFEGCPNSHLGASILLRGGTEYELKKVKKVTLMMIFAAYSSKLEISYLMDEFANLPSPNSFLDDSSQNSSPVKSQDSETDPNNKSITKNKSDLAKMFKIDYSNDKKNIENEFLKKKDSFHTDVGSPNLDDTLNLFRMKNSSSPKDSTNNLLKKESESNIEKEIAKEKIISEDKRVHGESISDKSDPLHQYLNEDRDEVINQNSPSGCLSVAELPLLNKFKTALEGTILSISPYLKFSIPFLETEVGRNCILRNFFPKDLYYSSYFCNNIQSIKINTVFNEVQAITNSEKMEKSRHLFTTKKLTSTVENREIQSLLAHFRACGSGNYFKNKNSLQQKQPVNQTESADQQILTPWPDCLDPNSHQRLSVLFCSFLSNNESNTSTFCVDPWVVNMNLYGQNDITLGKFLERYCLTKNYKCPSETCKGQVSQHERRFVHDGGCVHISLCELNSDPLDEKESNKIFMWSKCTKCKNVPLVVPMSDDSWSISFAKFLELYFHGYVYTRRNNDDCTHSLHHDHQRYFSKKNMLAIFRYSKISQWEISLPPPLIHIYYDPKQYTNILEEIKGIALMGDEVYTTIKEKVNSLQLDPDINNALKQQIAKDQQQFKIKIEEIQLKLTSPSFENKRIFDKSSNSQMLISMYQIEDGIVIIKRLIAEAVSTWNEKIADLTSKKKDEKTKKTADRTISGTSSIIESDGYITEDTVSESQTEDLSPVSADYNAIEAINTNDLLSADVTENSDAENLASEDVIQNSPKSQSVLNTETVSQTSEEVVDKKKKKKTILSQLLPSLSIVDAISNPLNSLEHYFLPIGSAIPIVVYESEPSSIISYALNSNDYKQASQEQLKQMKSSDVSASPIQKRKSQDSKETNELSQTNEIKRPSVLSFLRVNSTSLASPSDSEKGTTQIENSSTNVTSSDADEEKKSSKQQQNYIEVQFSDSTTNFFCRVYFAAQFAALRENILPCGEDGYIRSLTRSISWAARGGKSGSTFCKTLDDRFVIKEMNRLDMQIFLEFAPNYFAYIEKCQQKKQPTLLGKIVGIYRISFKNNTTNAALRTSVLVMENLFYNRKITDKFDLKGSVRNRLANTENIENEGELVLLDENLLNMSCDSPLYIRPHSKAVLNKAIEEDTKFLANNCVMDYSLLVGLEPNSDELVLGIIDYIRTFTWDKKIETIVKKSGILGGQGKLPTIVSPSEYRSRFIEAMHKYFLPVPDRWTGLSRGVVTN